MLSLRAGSLRISPSIVVFFPVILFPTKKDWYLSGNSCTCFGIVFILVPYLIVCASARFSDLKWEASLNLNQFFGLSRQEIKSKFNHTQNEHVDP
jgi:hypothetical protein